MHFEHNTVSLPSHAWNRNSRTANKAFLYRIGPYDLLLSLSIKFWEVAICKIRYKNNYHRRKYSYSFIVDNTCQLIHFGEFTYLNGGPCPTIVLMLLQHSLKKVPCRHYVILPVFDLHVKFRYLNQMVVIINQSQFGHEELKYKYRISARIYQISRCVKFLCCSVKSVSRGQDKNCDVSADVITYPCWDYSYFMLVSRTAGGRYAVCYNTEIDRWHLQGDWCKWKIYGILEEAEIYLSLLQKIQPFTLTILSYIQPSDLRLYYCQMDRPKNVLHHLLPQVLHFNP